MNDLMRGFQPNAEGSNQENWRQGQGYQVRTMGITAERAIMFEMETTTATTSIRVIMVTEMIKVGLMSLLKIGKLLLGMVEVLWCELKICYKR